jgi:hypothetical protein
MFKYKETDAGRAEFSLYRGNIIVFDPEDDLDYLEYGEVKKGWQFVKGHYYYDKIRPAYDYSRRKVYYPMPTTGCRRRGNYPSYYDNFDEYDYDVWGSAFDYH